MAYGLRIINDSSELLIDSEYVNPTFVQKLEFNSTPTSTESGIYVNALNQLHAGYLKSTYTTPVAILNTGNYTVLWKIPDNGNIDVYYNFPTSVMDVNRTLTCEVYSGGSFSYTLPTAYIFAVDSGGLSTLSSSAPALRMYNSSQQLTFNSSYTQLIPYSFSSGFLPPSIGNTTSVPITSPTNAIYLLPKAYYLYALDDSANPGTIRQILFDLMYKRFGSTMHMKSISSYWNSVNGSTVIVNDGYGVGREVTILAADGDLYQGANGSSISTTAPAYTLGANYATVNETNNTTITVTLTTTNVTNGTLVYYNVTGINAADLTSGSLTGSFNVQSNTATKSFVVATDGITESTEIFLLTLVGITQSISISILDTSRTPYSWSAPSATSVDEGSSIYIDFNALYNDSTYPVTFGFEYPATPIPGQSGATIYAYPDINFTYAIPSGASYTRVTVSPRADLQLEGLEKWRMFAEVGGTRYYSADITINDTTTSSITAANNWIVGTDNTVTINVIGGLGSTVYLLSNPDSAILLKPGSASSWYVNSNNFTVSTIYQAVGLYSVPGSDLQSQITLLRQNAAGAQLEGLANKYITTSSPAATYTLTPAASSVNEGSSLTFTVGGTNIPNGTYYWSLSNAGDFVTNANSFTITNNSGSFSVTPTADTTTEGAETFYAIIQDSGLNTLKTSSTITINDTSLATYTLTPSVTSVNEGGSFTITFNTNQSGSFPYTITGVTSADLFGASLTGTLANGGYHIFAVSNDMITDGTKTFTITLNNGQASTTVTIYDTSVTPPAYSFTSQQNVTETQVSNSIATFTFTNVVNKTVTFAIVAPSSGAAATSGTDVTINITSMSINGSSFKEVSYYPAADQITENTEYFRITATIDGSVVATTSNIQITDSSIYPAAGTLLSQSCEAYGVAPYTLNKVYANGNGGTYTEGTYNSPTCGYVAATYTLTPAASSVNEGSSLTFTVGGTNIPNGTYYWSVPTGTDFVTNAGSFTITNNSGSFSVTPAADAATEGAETFSASILDSGLNTLKTSSLVTINDTSLTPPAAYTFNLYPEDISENSVNGTAVFSFSNAVNKTVTFAKLYPSVGSSAVPDVTLNTTTGTANGTGTINVTYSAAADSFTEGDEYFRITATIDGSVVATTSGIQVADTSTTPVAATPIWRISEVNTTWTVPTGTTSIYLALIGAGGGGRTISNSGGGGGAGGVYYSISFAVTPGDVLSFVVGTGGTSNTPGGSTTMAKNGTIVATAAGGGAGSGNVGGTAGYNSLYGLTHGGGLGDSISAGGGGGSGGEGWTGADGEAGDGGLGIEFNIDGVDYAVAGGGGGGGILEGFGGTTVPNGFITGAGNGGHGSSFNSSTSHGTNATKTGSGGGGGRRGGSGGAGFKGKVWWYG